MPSADFARVYTIELEPGDDPKPKLVKNDKFPNREIYRWISG